MCGIAGILLKEKVHFNLSQKIASMSAIIQHRGPDGEGFMIASPGSARPYLSDPGFIFKRTDLNYIPTEPLTAAMPDAFLAFAHRRLAIIDLSDSGHQPMCNKASQHWIVFNGEIYNYLELREELRALGHVFISESDTEVILAAYREWGFDCVKKFNGMWAFCLYDAVKRILFASRDRLGVKPFYYVNDPALFAFASEQKAFIKSGLIPFRINRKALHHYLVNDLLENETHNFFEGVYELWPGTNLVYDIEKKTIALQEYYNLKNELSLKNDALSEETLIQKIKVSFETAVSIRLRSDVEVGTCLSGGLDSSALAVTIAKETNKPLHCFTSIFRGQAFNEETFADKVAAQINAKHHKTEPSLEGFEKEIDALIYSQDVPIWSTSTYAQYKVMELAKANNIKVVLDGQGADELFAGYHHHFVAKWNNLLSQGRYATAITEIQAANKTIPGAFLFYAKERLKQRHFFNKKHFSLFLKTDFLNTGEIKNPALYFNTVNDQLLNDIYCTRLKSFLKCEDRCGMWHSVESRTPFSDDEPLMSLLFSFDGNKKIKNGVSKYLLREAVKDRLPQEIYLRYDKKGFETPMQTWMMTLKPKLIAEVKAAEFDFVRYDVMDSWDMSNSFHYKLLFKLFVLSRWRKAFS